MHVWLFSSKNFKHSYKPDTSGSLYIDLNVIKAFVVICNPW